MEENKKEHKERIFWEALLSLRRESLVERIIREEDEKKEEEK